MKIAFVGFFYNEAANIPDVPTQLKASYNFYSSNEDNVR